MKTLDQINSIINLNTSNNTNNIFKSEKNLNEKINILRNSEFAKSQIDGIWPEEFKDKKKN